MFETLDNAANLAAINQYMGQQRPINDEAGKAKNAWIIWYDRLGWWDKTYPSQAVYDYARNLKNAFNRANAPTPEAKKQVEQVIQTGVSSEESRGEADRRLASGDYTTKQYDQ